MPFSLKSDSPPALLNFHGRPLNKEANLIKSELKTLLNIKTLLNTKFQTLMDTNFLNNYF